MMGRGLRAMPRGGHHTFWNKRLQPDHKRILCIKCKLCLRVWHGGNGLKNLPPYKLVSDEKEKKNLQKRRKTKRLFCTVVRQMLTSQVLPKSKTKRKNTRKSLVCTCCSLSLSPTKTVHWPQTLLFWPQTCLSNLLLIISALPAHTIGKLCDQLNLPTFWTYRGTVWEVKWAFWVKMVNGFGGGN